MTNRYRTTLARFARLLVMVGQLALLVAAGTEGIQGPSAAPHIERSGISQHYAHNEATCVSCTVLSMHARQEAAYVPLPVLAAFPQEAPSPAPTRVVAQQWTRDHPSRAPPQRS